MTHSNRQRGFTLIELVIAIVIIGISTATVSRLLVSGLNFADNTISYSKELLRARAAYETLLAIDEADKWGDAGLPSKCDTEDWNNADNPADVLEIGDDGSLDLLEGVSCRTSSGILDSGEAVFTIPIGKDELELKLAVPQ